jgi:peroxiredoxin
MALAVNTPAPLFTLKHKTAEGFEDVSLADYIGKKKVVLLFYPFAFSGICTDELCSVSGGIDQYEALNAEVFGISVDLPFAQEAFANSAGISFPLLSDFNKEASTAYDVLYGDILGLKGVSKRSAFVIGLDGNIVYSTSSDDPKVVPSFEEIQAALQ